MNIVVIGHVCIDYNHAEHAVFTGAGGPAMFMSKIFRQLPEVSLTVAAPYGADFLPYAAGVRLFPDAPQDIRTMVYENHIKNGSRTQKCFHHETAKPPVLGDRLESLISDADVVCLAPLAPNYPAAYVREVKKAMDHTGVFVLLPQGYFRRFNSFGTVGVREFTEAPDIVPLTDFVIVSQEDHPDMDAMALRWSGNGPTVLITKAEQGAVIAAGGSETQVPTVRVPPEKIVSSVGAGDVFAAGFIYQYARTQDALISVRFANALARQCLAFTPENIRLDLAKLI